VGLRKDGSSGRRGNGVKVAAGGGYVASSGAPGSWVHGEGRLSTGTNVLVS